MGGHEDKAKDEDKSMEAAREREQPQEPPASTSRQDTSDDEEDDVEMEGDMNLDFRVRCPLYKIPQLNCPWIGTPGNLQNHVTHEHTDILQTGPRFKCKSLTDNGLLILYNSEIFLYYKRIEDDGTWHALVQQLGTTDKKYRYKIQLTSGDPAVENINLTFRVKNISESFERIFDSGRCMAMQQNVMKRFVRNGEINMTITMNEISSRRQI
jgi:hypothetical protein